MSPDTILYAEDEPTDIFFLERAFKLASVPHSLKSVADGQAAIDYLSGVGLFVDRNLHPLPCLILLDINMPKKSGLEVLEWIRKEARLKDVPGLILTSSSHPGDREKARQLAADDYLLKPSNPTELLDLVKAIQRRWLSGPAELTNEKQK
jgi:CheY-like chemotaxis protein